MISGEEYDAKNQVINQEANIFAVCLLIPEDRLRKELNKKNLDLTDDTEYNRICELFGVTASAMAFRLALLYNKNQKYKR